MVSSSFLSGSYIYIYNDDRYKWEKTVLFCGKGMSLWSKRNGSGGHFSYGKQMLLDNIWKKWRLRAGFWKSVGGAVMKFHKGQPEKRRYVALLVPESSSLTGTDDWKAGQLRQQCEEAGWKVQCSSTYWQIFYTTDDAVKRVGDMKEEKQFQLQRSLSWNWW